MYDLDNMIGMDIEEVEAFLVHEHLWFDDMVRISTTPSDRYYFYKLSTEEREDACIEVYFNEDGTVYDIQVNRY